MDFCLQYGYFLYSFNFGCSKGLAGLYEVARTDGNGLGSDRRRMVFRITNPVKTNRCFYSNRCIEHGIDPAKMVGYFLFFLCNR